MCAGESISTMSLFLGVQGSVHTIQKECPCFIVRSNTLQKCQSIADSVGCCSCELGGVQKCVDGNDLLEEGSHNA